jgi:hypothetical protein
MNRDSARGYTDKELIDEKNLLLDKSRAITWEWLPLIEFPHARPLPGSQKPQAGPIVAKFSDLPPDKLEACEKGVRTIY